MIHRKRGEFNWKGQRRSNYEAKTEAPGNRFWKTREEAFQGRYQRTKATEPRQLTEELGLTFRPILGLLAGAA